MCENTESSSYRNLSTEFIWEIIDFPEFPIYERAVLNYLLKISPINILYLYMQMFAKENQISGFERMHKHIDTTQYK